MLLLQKPKLLEKLLLPKQAKQKARLFSVPLACRKKAAALGALTPASPFWVLDLPYNHRRQKVQQTKRRPANRRPARRRRPAERRNPSRPEGQKEIVPHLLPGTEAPREAG